MSAYGLILTDPARVSEEEQRAAIQAHCDLLHICIVGWIHTPRRTEFSYKRCNPLRDPVVARLAFGDIVVCAAPHTLAPTAREALLRFANILQHKANVFFANGDTFLFCYDSKSDTLAIRECVRFIHAFNAFVYRNVGGAPSSPLPRHKRKAHAHEATIRKMMAERAPFERIARACGIAPQTVRQYIVEFIDSNYADSIVYDRRKGKANRKGKSK